MQHDTTLTRTEIRRTLTAFEPRWDLRDATATPSEAEHHALYRLAVDTPTGPRECYLKATPDGKDATLGLEASVLAVLNARTDLPVPAVHGLLEQDDDVPTPAVLLEALPGDSVPRTDPGRLSPAEHRRVARTVGRHLATLHAVDAVGAFGFLAPAGPQFDGDRPDGESDCLAVADPTDDWRERLTEWTEGTLDRLHGTRFDDVTSTARAAIESGVAGLDGPFEPALARIDQSLENLLLEDGAVSGLVDWEFTMAATPAYDAVHVAASLAGGPFVFAPSVTDRRDLVFDALVAGYRDRDPATADRIESHRQPYDLLFALRAMANLDDWFGMLGLGDEVDDAATALRREVSDR